MLFKAIFRLSALLALVFTTAYGSCRTAPVHYKVITSGTCESAGLLPVTNAELCDEAGKSVGWRWSWSTRSGGYKDVVDGCSFRDKHSLFVQRSGTCKVGHAMPSWIPLLNGKANCQCSAYQPCVCIQRYTLLKEQTCEAFGANSVYSRSDCLTGAKIVAPIAPSHIPDHFNPLEVDGCIVFRNRATWLQPRGVCRHRCYCSHEYACVCDRKYIPIKSGTCEGHGLKTIVDWDKCEKAFAYFGWNYIWSTPGLSGYSDVVDGCSFRGGHSKFSQARGKCTSGLCQCTAYQPCACEL